MHAIYAKRVYNLLLINGGSVRDRHATSKLSLL